MATFDTTAADAALKTIFQDPISDQVIAKSDLLDLFTQMTNVIETDQGKQVTVSNIYGDPEGVGARAEGDYIPAAIDPLFLKQNLFLKYLYGRVQMTKQVMQQMTRGQAAFLDWADAELTRLERAVRQDLDRQLFGYGAGIIARVNDASPDATLGVDSAYGIAGITNAAELFRVGAKYRFFGSADATAENNGGLTGATVQSVARGTQIVTFESGTPDIPTDTADDDFIIRGDTAGHSGQKSGTDREVMGLFGHLDDGNILASYFAGTRSTYSFLNAQIVDGSASPYSGNLTETLLMKANDDAIQFGNGNPDAAVTTRGVLRNFFAQLKVDRTFNDPRSFTGGARDLNVQLGDTQIQLRAARQAPEGVLFGIDRSTLIRIHNTGWEWDDTTGAIFKQVSDATGVQDAFYAYGRWFMQTFCKSPQANFRIDSLDESVA